MYFAASKALPLPSQIDENSLFALLYLLLLWWFLSFLFHCQWGHILSNSSNFKWSALWEDPQIPLSNSSFSFSFFNALVYFFVLLGDFGPLYITRRPSEVYFVPISSQPQGFVIIFICIVSVGTDNWIGTSFPLKRGKKPSILFLNLSLSSVCRCFRDLEALVFNMLPVIIIHILIILIFSSVCLSCWPAVYWPVQFTFTNRICACRGRWYFDYIWSELSEVLHNTSQSNFSWHGVWPIGKGAYKLLPLRLYHSVA